MNDSSSKYFTNPAFREYVFLLVELERLIREGRNESPEGDAIYDAMDGPGDRLNGEEMQAVKAFASDLTRLSEQYAPLLLPTAGPSRLLPNATVAPTSPLPPSPADSPKELIP